MQSYGKKTEHIDFDSLFRKGEYLKIASEFRAYTPSAAYSKFIKEHLDPDDLIASELHQLILNAGFRGILTTNFDYVFEKSDPNLRTLRYPDHFESVEHFRNSNFVAKIHGCVRHSIPKNLILTAEDYTKLEKDRKYRTILRALYSENTFLTIGYSLSDPDFHSLVKSFEIFGENAPKLFALMHSNNTDSMTLSNVEIINFENYNELPQIIKSIGHFISKQKETLNQSKAYSREGRIDESGGENRNVDYNAKIYKS